MKHGALDGWVNQTSRNAGAKYTQVKAPEWAYCSADRFEEIRYQAWFLKTTISNMQGGWGYPAEKEEGVRVK